MLMLFAVPVGLLYVTVMMVKSEGMVWPAGVDVDVVILLCGDDL